MADTRLHRNDIGLPNTTRQVSIIFLVFCIGVIHTYVFLFSVYRNVFYAITYRLLAKIFAHGGYVCHIYVGHISHLISIVLTIVIIGCFLCHPLREIIVVYCAFNVAQSLRGSRAWFYAMTCGHNYSIWSAWNYSWALSVKDYYQRSLTSLLAALKLQFMTAAKPRESEGENTWPASESRQTPSLLVSALRVLDRKCYGSEAPATRATHQVLTSFMRHVAQLLGEADPRLQNATLVGIGSHFCGLRTSRLPDEMDWLLTDALGPGMRVEMDGGRSIVLVEEGSPGWHLWSKAWSGGSSLLTQVQGGLYQLNHWATSLHFRCLLNHVMSCVRLPKGFVHGGPLAPFFSGVGWSSPAATIILLDPEQHVFSRDISLGITIPLSVVSGDIRTRIATLVRCSGMPQLDPVSLHVIPGKEPDAGWMASTAVLETRVLSHLGLDSPYVRVIRDVKLLTGEYLAWGAPEDLVQRVRDALRAWGQGVEPDATRARHYEHDQWPHLARRLQLLLKEQRTEGRDGDDERAEQDGMGDEIAGRMARMDDGGYLWTDPIPGLETAGLARLVRRCLSLGFHLPPVRRKSEEGGGREEAYYSRCWLAVASLHRQHLGLGDGVTPDPKKAHDDTDSCPMCATLTLFSRIMPRTGLDAMMRDWEGLNKGDSNGDNDQPSIKQRLEFMHAPNVHKREDSLVYFLLRLAKGGVVFNPLLRDAAPRVPVYSALRSFPSEELRICFSDMLHYMLREFGVIDP